MLAAPGHYFYPVMKFNLALYSADEHLWEGQEQDASWNSPSIKTGTVESGTGTGSSTTR
jgi:hypothetical protein